MAPLSGHVEAASHTPQLEESSTKIYNYVPRRFGEIKQKKTKERRRLATVVSSGANLLKKKKEDRKTFDGEEWSQGPRLRYVILGAWGDMGGQWRWRNGHLQGGRNLMVSAFSMKETPTSSDQSGEWKRK